VIQSRTEFREGVRDLVRFYSKYGRSRADRDRARGAARLAKAGNFHDAIDFLLDAIQVYAEIIPEGLRPPPIKGAEKAAMENLVYRSSEFERGMAAKPEVDFRSPAIRAMKAGWIFMVNLTSESDPGPVNCLTSTLWNWDAIRPLATNPESEPGMAHRLPIHRLDDPFGSWILSEPYGCSACVGIPSGGACSPSCISPEVCGALERIRRLERMITGGRRRVTSRGDHLNRIWDRAGRTVRPLPSVLAVREIATALETWVRRLKLSEFDLPMLAARLRQEVEPIDPAISLADIENVLDSLVSLASVWQGGGRFLRAREHPNLVVTHITGHGEALTSISEDPTFPLLVESLQRLSRSRSFKRWIYRQIDIRLEGFEEVERKRRSRRPARRRIGV
jgi:hypothetical protein